MTRYQFARARRRTNVPAITHARDRSQVHRRSWRSSGVRILATEARVSDDARNVYAHVQSAYMT